MNQTVECFIKETEATLIRYTTSYNCGFTEIKLTTIVIYNITLYKQNNYLKNE